MPVKEGPTNYQMEIVSMDSTQTQMTAQAFMFAGMKVSIDAVF